MSEAGKSFGCYLEALERAASVDEVRESFLAATAHFGFEHVALFNVGHGVPPGRGIHFTRIPPAWLARYHERRYYEIDPVVSAVRRRLTPFSWNDPAYRRNLSDAQKAMLAESNEAGLVEGLAIPIGGIGALPACCTLVPGRGGVDPSSYSMAHSLAVFAHARARSAMGELLFASHTALTRRERECLFLAARGKSDWVIGEMLGIAESTVHHAIERAKKRLGVATRVQAIVHAIARNEFSATDAMG